MTRKEAISYLVALGEEMSEQDNLGTSFPVFQVQELTKVYGIDPDYHDSVEVDSVKVEYGSPDDDFIVPEEDHDAVEPEIETGRLMYADPEDEGTLTEVRELLYVMEWRDVPGCFSLSREHAEAMVRERCRKAGDPERFTYYACSMHANPSMRRLYQALLEVGGDGGGGEVAYAPATGVALRCPTEAINQAKKWMVVAEEVFWRGSPEEKEEGEGVRVTTYEEAVKAAHAKVAAVLYGDRDDEEDAEG